jgi:chemotaxis protein MotC
MRPIALSALIFTLLGVAHAYSSEAEAPVEPPSHAEALADTGGVESKPELASQIEELFRLQDESARGSVDSLPAQKTLLVKIGGKLADEPLDHANSLAHYTAAYVLSGGNPDVAVRLSAADGLPHAKKSLLEAVAIFMRGDRESAGERLALVDPTTLPPFLAGRLALARAVIAEPKSALQQDDLAFAIASMPGTLVEESALRRSALAYAESGNESLFYRRLARYCRRFPDSIYADSFWSDAIRLLIRWDLKEPDVSFSRFAQAVGIVDKSRQKKIYLELAKRAAIAGKRVLMERAAEELRKLSDPNSPEQNISQLYQNLYLVATSGDKGALEKLNSISQQDLDQTEQSLRSAAISLGRSLMMPLQPSDDAKDVEPAESSPLVERGNAILGQSDDVLSQVRS